MSWVPYGDDDRRWMRPAFNGIVCLCRGILWILWILVRHLTKRKLYANR
jgi:hypothetical protein